MVEFKPHSKDLNYLDLSDQNKFSTVTLVTTVRERCEGIQRGIQKAITSSRLQGMIGQPFWHSYKGIVHEELINNFPLSLTDIKNAHAVFGSDLTGLSGKTVCQNPEHVNKLYVEIPINNVSLNHIIHDHFVKMYPANFSGACACHNC